MAIMSGKKTFLFNVTMADLDTIQNFFFDDENSVRLGYFDWDMQLGEKLPQLLTRIVNEQLHNIWLVQTKEGKATRKIGYFWLTPITPSACNIEGLINGKFIQGLDKELEKDKYTYVEDALRTVVRHIFADFPIHRIGIVCVAKKTPVVDLISKVGFKKEGKIRDIINYDDDKYADVFQFSILKDEMEG